MMHSALNIVVYLLRIMQQFNCALFHYISYSVWLLAVCGVIAWLSGKQSRAYMAHRVQDHPGIPVAQATVLTLTPSAQTTVSVDKNV